MATTQMTGAYGYLNYLQEKQPTSYEAQIMESFIESNGLMTKIGRPHNEGAFERKQKRIIANLMKGTSAAIGAANPTPQLQPINDYVEGVFMYRDMIQTDIAYSQVKDYVYQGGPLPWQMKQYSKGLAFTMENALINNYSFGGPIADPLQVTGIKARLAFPQQTGSGCNSACNVAATADLSDAGLSSTGGLKIARDIKRTLSHMGNERGTGVIILLSPQAWWQLTMVIANQGQAGGFTTSKDAFDRDVIMYYSAQISSCGFLPPQDGGLQIAPIIDDAQDVNGWSSGDAAYAGTGGGSYTTMYFIQTEGDEKFSLWQVADPLTRVWDQVPGQFYGVGMMMTWLGIWQPNTRSIARLLGVKVNGSAFD